MLVAMFVASEDATSGSVMQNADRISPSSSGSSQSRCCCGLPNSASSSMLPVSGAAQFSASGARAGLRPVISASGAYCRLVSPAPRVRTTSLAGLPPPGRVRNRFHRRPLPRLPGRLGRGGLLGEDTLGRVHVAVHEGQQPLAQFLGPGVEPEIHRAASRGASGSGPEYLPAGISPRYGLTMAQVETVRGPVDAGRLGVTLMHEHVFVLNEEIRRNYPAGWDEEE